MDTAPDPADLPDLPDPVRRLLLGTYHLSRAGVRMTAVLNKLPQINPAHASISKGELPNLNSLLLYSLVSLCIYSSSESYRQY